MRRILFTAILVVACATDVGTPSVVLAQPSRSICPQRARDEARCRSIEEALQEWLRTRYCRHEMCNDVESVIHGLM